MGTRSTRVQTPQTRFSSQPESTNTGSIIGLLRVWRVGVAPRCGGGARGALGRGAVGVLERTEHPSTTARVTIEMSANARHDADEQEEDEE